MVNKLLDNSKLVKKIAVPLVVLLFVVILGCQFDFFYALNDDTGIRDLLSGNYAGTPEAHCMQILYPMALLYASLYKIMPSIPWFGIGMLLVQCLVLVGITNLIVKRILAEKSTDSDCEISKAYIGVAVLVVAVLAIITLKEFVFLQYTVVSAFVCIYVIADILLSESDKENLILDVIVFLYALSLREEMGLLMIPFIGLAIFIKCDLSFKQIFSRKWIGFGIALLIGMAVLFTLDSLAYSGKWGEFRQFFNARTQVYDYTGIPEYEENKEFYEKNNISYNQYESLKQYNFALDESIDTECLNKIANYVKEKEKITFARKIYLAAYTLVYEFLHGWELRYYLLILTGYVFLFRLALIKKSRSLLLKLFIVLVLRMAIWIYMYSLGRQGGLVDRITHPLFFVELMLLISLFILDNNHQRWKFGTTFCIISTYACILMLFSFGQMKSVKEECDTRIKTNLEWEDFRKNVEQTSGYYYIDVYSAVKYSETIFSKGQERLRNYEIAGGWITKSPAFYKKAQLFGFDTPIEGIETGRAYFIKDVGEIVYFMPDKVK